MAFTRRAKQHNLSITKGTDNPKAYQDNLQLIANNLTDAEVGKLAQAVRNPIIKKAALAYLK